MSLEIRLLKKEDAEALWMMETELFSMPWTKQQLEALTTRAYCRYLVALEDGQIVGFAGMTILAGEADIDKVMVKKAYQNRGIGRKLLEALLRLGEEEQVEAYTLEVRASNEAAIHVYEKMGFLTEGVRPGFYERPKEDAFIMWRRKKPDAV